MKLGLAFGLNRDVPDGQTNEAVAGLLVELGPVDDRGFVGVEGGQKHPTEQGLMGIAAQADRATGRRRDRDGEVRQGQDRAGHGPNRSAVQGPGRNVVFVDLCRRRVAVSRGNEPLGTPQYNSPYGYSISQRKSAKPPSLMFESRAAATTSGSVRAANSSAYR